MQVDNPTYYPHGKERDGLLVFMLPKERKRYRKWFDWRLSHGEDAGQFQMTPRRCSPCRRIWPAICSGCSEQ